MLFNSIEFLLFLPVVYILYWFVCKRSLPAQNALVLLASYFFYGWWDWRFMLLLVFSTLLDYYSGILIDSKPQKKLFLWLSVCFNLAVLGVFKYYNFFATEFAAAFSSLGWQVQPYILKFALPVGISFYTFHGMSYVFDIYRGIIKPERNFVNYAMFVSFFPLLVAGPIERATHLLPQIIRPRAFSYDQSIRGLKLALWGFFKKIVIADNLAPVVNNIFAGYDHLNSLTLALGAIFFAFQIYCDFSGYSDIAIGVARLFGFELLSNFRFPYFSRDIAEFWRRWHISLSSWFRDYLYIPLGGSREGTFKSIRNSFIIFLVSGFWHGANWTFIAWGAIHATLFIPVYLAGKNRKHTSEVVAADRALPNGRELLAMLFTFVMVCLAWIFFRAENISQAIHYIGRMLHFKGGMPLYRLNLLYIIPVLCFDWLHRRDERNVLSRVHIVWVGIVAILLIMLLKPVNDNATFIYFQF